MTSRAKRPKNAWYVISTKVVDTYELSLVYQNSKGDSGPFSPSGQTIPVKASFGPPHRCEFKSRKDVEGKTVREFVFTNSKRKSAAFDEILFNNLKAGVNTFTQRMTSMFVEEKKILMAFYFSAAQHSKSFVFNDENHDEDGLALDGKGVTLEEVEENGGTLEDLRYFTKAARDNATFGDTADSAFAEVFKAGVNKKRKLDALGTKSYKKVSVGTNERLELEDEEGLEKKFQSTYMSVVWLSIGKISVSKELNIKPNIYRVTRIKESLKSKYDPAQAMIVVAPADDVEKLDITDKTMSYIVVQKVHTLCAMKELDKVDEFKQLTGHQHRKILCYIVNTRSIPLLRYGNMRSNDIASKYARKLYPQDLLHVYETLSTKDSSVNSIKVIERMAKLGRVGPNEATSIRKLCKWKKSAFDPLMEVIRQYEIYETNDVRSTGSAGNISRGEKLCMPNIVFNNLAKVDEIFFEANFQNIIDKKLSLRGLTEKSVRVNDVDKVYGVLSQITGYQTLDSLRKAHPGKFDIDQMEKYLGAERKGESRNLQAVLLESYYEGITMHVDIVKIKFESIKSLEDTKVKAAIDQFDAVVMVVKESAEEQCASIIKMIIQSAKLFQIGFFLFPSEIMHFDILTFLRSQNTRMLKDFKIIPVSFNNSHSQTVDFVEENLKYGIIFGKFCILNPPLKVFLGDLKVEDILVKVVPPESTVAVISEPGLSILQAHSEHLPFKSVVYHGSDDEIKKFRLKLNRDKLLLSKQKVQVDESFEESITSPSVSSKESFASPSGDSSDSDESIVSPSKEITDSNDESSTSPAKETTELIKVCSEAGESTSKRDKYSPESACSIGSFEYHERESSSMSQDSGCETSPFVTKPKSLIVKKLINSEGFSDTLDTISSEI